MPYTPVGRRIANLCMLGLLSGAVLSGRPCPAQEAKNAATSSAKQAEKFVVPTARPFLWMIEGPTPSFVYGTIHLADDRIMQIPDVVLAAFDRSDAFYAEVPMDMSAMADAMGPRMRLPAGKTLKTELSPALYKRVDDYLQRRGMGIAAFEGMKVWVVSTQVSTIDALKETGSFQGLDMHLYAEATADGKEVGGIETVQEQMAAFEGLTDAEHVEMLEKTMKQLEEYEKRKESTGRRIMDLYLAGDQRELMRYMFEFMDPNDKLDQKSLELLLTSRDKRMAERIAKKIEQHPNRSYFFAVGAAHLSGEKVSVLTHLRDAGLKLRRLKPGDETLFKRP